MPADHPAAKNIATAADLIGKVLEDVRDVSRNLSLDTIRNVGLLDAMENLVGQLERTGAFNIEFNIEGEYKYMEEQKEIILFRIFQEAINNIIRHANATTIAITLDCSKDRLLRLSVRDDGKGFEMTPRGRRTTGGVGAGLNNICSCVAGYCRPFFL